MLKIYFSLLLIASLFTPASTNAQEPYETRKSQTSGVEFSVSNYGIFGQNLMSDSGLYYPRGSGRGYLFSSGLWFGARKSVDDSVVDLSIITYNHGSGESWVDPGGWRRTAPEANTYLDRISYSPEYRGSDGVWIGPSPRRPAWPLWNEGNSGPTLFDPGTFIGDSASREPGVLSGVPAFVPGVSEQFVSRFHDGNLARYEGDQVPGLPLGLQFEENIYAFAQPGLDNIVILHYRIINVSGDTLMDCHAARLSDPDLGKSSNDHSSYYAPRAELGSVYTFSESTMGDGTRFGTFVETLLESPAVDEQPGEHHGFIRHDRRRYDRSEQVGATTVWNVGIEDIPISPAMRYRFMASGRLDGDNGPGDKRTLLATGPFTMLPGDTARFVIGLTILPDLHGPNAGAQPVIEAAAEKVIRLYESESISGVRENRSNGGALSIGAIHPNPASGSSTTLDLILPHRSAPRIQLVDALGRVALVRELGMLEAGTHSIRLDLDGVTPGVHQVIIETGAEHDSQTLIVPH